MLSCLDDFVQLIEEAAFPLYVRLCFANEPRT